MGNYTSIAEVCSVTFAAFKHAIGPSLLFNDSLLIFEELYSLVYRFRAFLGHYCRSAPVPLQSLGWILILVKLKHLEDLLQLWNESGRVFSDVLMKLEELVVHLRDPRHVGVITLHQITIL